MSEKLVLVVALAVPLGIAWVGLPRLADMHLFSADSGLVQILSPRPPSSQVRQISTPEAIQPSTPSASILNPTPPPTLAPPSRPTVEPSPTPAEAEPRGRATITGTEGRGAVLRAEPVTGRQVAALREGQTVDILESRKVNNVDWVHVRVQQGVEGWVIGYVLSQVPTSAPRGTATPGSPPIAPAAPPRPTAVPTASPPNAEQTHTVERGEELRHIAEEYGVSVEDLMANNSIPDPDSLTVGQVLTIP